MIDQLAETEGLELDPETETELEDLKEELQSAIGEKKHKAELKKARSSRQSCLTQVVRHNHLNERTFSLPYGTLAELEAKAESALCTSQIETKERLGTRLIEDENMELGGVKWDVYKYFFESIGIKASCVMLLMYLSYQGFSVGANIWLSSWSSDPLASTDISVKI